MCAHISLFVHNPLYNVHLYILPKLVCKWMHTTTHSPLHASTQASINTGSWFAIASTPITRQFMTITSPWGISTESIVTASIEFSASVQAKGSTELSNLLHVTGISVAGRPTHCRGSTSDRHSRDQLVPPIVWQSPAECCGRGSLSV